MATETAIRPEEAIKLFIPEPEDGHVSSVVPLRWCISRRVAERLNKQEITDPQLLIVISNDGHEMDRHVVPLTDEMRYIQFRRPGKNVVHATVVWRRSDRDHPRYLLNRKTDKGEYRISVLEQGRPAIRRLDQEISEATQERRVKLRIERHEHRNDLLETVLFDSFSDIERLPVAEAALAVEVPEEMFAREPNWIIKLLSGVIWKKDPRDECQMRKRALITGILSPILLIVAALVGTTAIVIVFGWWLISAVAAGALLFIGKRGLDLSGVTSISALLSTDPEYKVQYIWKRMGPSVWTNEKVVKFGLNRQERTSYKKRPVFYWMVNPPMFTLVFGVTLMQVLVSNGYWVNAFPYATMIVVGAGVFFTLLNWGADGIIDKGSQKLADRREANEKTRQWETAQAIDALACGAGVVRTPSLKELPKERRTVYLRFQALKAQVCRPFAG